MKGNTFSEFMNDLLTMGGPEKEFVYRGKSYFLESTFDSDKQLIKMYIFGIYGNDFPEFSFWGKDFPECVKQFEEAKIFDGKTIEEIEQEIEVLYG